MIRNDNKLSGFLFAGLLFFLTGCSSRLDPDSSPVKRLDLTFESYFENSYSTRTQFSDKDSTRILWSVGDKISLFWNGYSSACFSSVNKDTALTTQFKGTIEVISGMYEEGAGEVPRFLAVYPYNEKNACDGSCVTFDVDSLQWGVARSLPRNGFPAMASSVNMNLAFYNVCGGLAFSLVNNNIKSIELTSNAVAGKRPAVGGRIKAGFGEDGKPVITEIVDSVYMITLRPESGDTFLPGVVYYMTILPGVFENGFNMTFYTQTLKGTKEINKNVEVKRSVFGKLMKVDEGLDFKVCVEAVKITSDLYEFDLGTDYPLGVEVTPDYATDKRMLWSSSDEAIATVNSEGVVTPVAVGTCSIMVQSVDNKLACDTCEVRCVKVNHLSRTEGEPTWANCYIIPASGVYDLEPVRGVSGASIGTASSVEVLWEYVSADDIATKGCLVTSVCLRNGKVRIYTPDVLKNGSASVAVKDASGNILWSWHLWINKDFNPEATGKFYNNGVQVMDRHLGALKAGSNCPQALLYQWGRKDPFIPNNKPSAFSTGVWPDKVESSASTGNMQYAIANPMCFIKGESTNLDWYYVSDALKTVRWTDDKKTDYDPCPYGWRVPTGGPEGFWEKAAGSKTYVWTFNDGGGADLKDAFNLSESEWYQCTGFLDSDGVFSANNYVTMLWSSTFCQKTSYLMSVNYGLKKIDTTGTDYSSDGCGIRCVKDSAE